jgi:hypothetical protein
MSKCKYTKKEFEKAVKTSRSVRQVLIKLGVSPLGSSYQTFHKKAREFDTDISHFNTKLDVCRSNSSYMQTSNYGKEIPIEKHFSNEESSGTH